MYKIKPLREGAIDALTGSLLPVDGVVREVLLPPDHYAERTGDISITGIRQAVQHAAIETVEVTGKRKKE